MLLNRIFLVTAKKRWLKMAEGVTKHSHFDSRVRTLYIYSAHGVAGEHPDGSLYSLINENSN